MLVDKYRINGINIEDDNFTFDMDRAKKILRMVVERKLKINWWLPNGVRADRLDYELLKLMKEAQFQTIWISVESGSQRVNNHIVGKDLNLKEVEKVVSIARKIKLRTVAFFLFGFPGETKKDMFKTILFALKLAIKGLDDAAFVVVVPHPGTPLFDIAKRNNYLYFLERETFYPVISTEKFSISDVKKIQIFAKVIFFLIYEFKLSSLKKALRHPVEMKNTLHSLYSMVKQEYSIAAKIKRETQVSWIKGGLSKY